MNNKTIKIGTLNLTDKAPPEVLMESLRCASEYELSQDDRDEIMRWLLPHAALFKPGSYRICMSMKSNPVVAIGACMDRRPFVYADGGFNLGKPVNGNESVDVRFFAEIQNQLKWRVQLQRLTAA